MIDIGVLGVGGTSQIGMKTKYPLGAGTHHLNLGKGNDATKDKPWRFVFKEPEYIGKMP